MIEFHSVNGVRVNPGVDFVILETKENRTLLTRRQANLLADNLKTAARQLKKKDEAPWVNNAH